MSYQRQHARGKDGRYANMAPCARCGKRAVLYPEYEADGVTMTDRDICMTCSLAPLAPPEPPGDR
jgi:hypothetical protein